MFCHNAYHSNRLPSSIINIRFQLPADRRRDAVRQPHVAEKLVVALLVENELAVAAQARVDLAVAVEVGRVVPRAVVVVKVEDGAFADVDEEADVLAASVLRKMLAINSFLKEGQGLKEGHTS